MKVESKVTVIISAGVAGSTVAGTGSSSATSKVRRRKVSWAVPASTGNICASTSAAVRYVSRAESCARSRSSSGVERACGGHPVPAAIVPQSAQRKRGNRTVTRPNSVAIACWR